jgi:hypothetical protein
LKRACKFNGLSIFIEADDAELLYALEAYLPVSKFSLEDSFNASVELVREPPVTSQSKPIVDCKLLDQVELAPEVTQTLWQGKNAYHLTVDHQFSLTLCAESNSASMKIGQSCSSLALFSGLLFAVDFALWRCGQYLLHAAAVALPWSQKSCAVIFAPSGHGKTTTTLSLAADGYGFITDDAVVLCKSSATKEPAMTVWGLPRDLKVHTKTANLLPVLAPLLTNIWNTDDEQSVAIAALPQIGIKTVRHNAEPDVLILLGPRNERDHQLLEISKTEFLMDVMKENLRASGKVGAKKTSEQFETLSALVSLKPTFSLSVGKDINSLASYLTRELQFIQK